MSDSLVTYSYDVGELSEFHLIDYTLTVRATVDIQPVCHIEKGSLRCPALGQGDEQSQCES